MTNGVYCLTSPTGKRYVGRAVNKRGNGIEVRWRQYKNMSPMIKGQPILYNALKHHGPENFKYEVVLETSDSNNADRSEMYLIDVWDLQNREKGYNLQPGGGTGNYGIPSKKKGKKLSEETIEKMRASHLGKPGVKHTTISNEKNRVAHIGKGVKMKTLTCQVCDKQWQVTGSSWKRNAKTCSDECHKILMEEHYKKLSLLKKGVKRSKETLEKMIKGREGKYKGVNSKRYGKKLSDETRNKISESRKKLYEYGIIVGRYYPRKNNNKQQG